MRKKIGRHWGGRDPHENRKHFYGGLENSNTSNIGWFDTAVAENHMHLEQPRRKQPRRTFSSLDELTERFESLFACKKNVTPEELT